jgi:hypothetical protein
MALAIAGAIDAMLGLIKTRDMMTALREPQGELDAGQPVQFGSLILDNAPFQAITLAYASQIGSLGGDLPERVNDLETFGV